jgi:hypothetical protein
MDGYYWYTIIANDTFIFAGVVHEVCSLHGECFFPSRLVEASYYTQYFIVRETLSYSYSLELEPMHARPMECSPVYFNKSIHTRRVQYNVDVNIQTRVS